MTSSNGVGITANYMTGPPPGLAPRSSRPPIQDGPPPGLTHPESRKPDPVILGAPVAQYGSPSFVTPNNGNPPVLRPTAILPHPTMPPQIPHQPFYLPYQAYQHHGLFPYSEFVQPVPFQPTLFPIHPIQSVPHFYNHPATTSPLLVYQTPHHSGPGPAPENTAHFEEPHRPTAPTYDLPVHRDWVGKLAPLPGFTSPPGLGPPPQRVKIRLSNQGVTSRPALKLPEPGTNPIPTVQPSRTHSSDLASPSSSRSPTLSPFSLSGSVINFNNSSENTKDKSIPQVSFFTLNKFADTFIPQYLKDVQTTIHRMIPLPPMPHFPDPAYLSTFLPRRLISEFSPPDSEAENPCNLYKHSLISSPAPVAETIPPLHPDSYHARWRMLLGFELSQVAEDKNHTVLWETGLHVWNFQEAEFTVIVPGIRENYPRLDPGDVIHLREVLKNHQTIPGNAFEGRITVLRKREGIVHFTSHELKKHIEMSFSFNPNSVGRTSTNIWEKDDELPMYFNFSFLTNPRPFCDMDLACQAVSQDLAEDGSNHARRWLFPQHADLGASFLLNQDMDEINETEFVDQGLNDEQKRAVSSIAVRHWPVPYLISGPPGTGKTRTIVEAVLQLLRRQSDATILLCAPSNPATDILALRLKEHLKPKEMLRLNDITRTFAEVPLPITQYCYVENDRFGVPPWEQLMSYRLVVCSCSDAMILFKAHCTNKALARLEEMVMHGLYPHKPRRTIKPHWTHLLIDEAAQGMEAELAIPISVLLAHQPKHTELPDIDFQDGMSSPQIVLCGDANQLGPIVASSDALDGGLNISLLERLFQRQLYAEHEFSRSKMAKSTYIPRERTGAIPFTDLVKNYRSHPVILMTPSALFYDDTLEPYATNGFVHWSGLSNPHFPLKFIGHDYHEDCNDERVNFFNLGDIQRIVETCQSLLSDATSADPPLQASQIGVIAPWREQVWKIRERLRKEGLGDVDVGTVEDYQGRENRVIILSCVRSNSKFLREDEEKGVGLVFERKRMNVAVTRSKELLVVIGNGQFLMRDPYWRSYLQFALRNKLYTGPELDIMPDPNYISRLESVYMRTPGTDVELDEEEQAFRLAGDLAREVLKE